MMKLVEHLVEPRRLLLTWQSLDPRHRQRHAVGELTPSSFRYLTDTPDFALARQKGFAGFPAFALSSMRHRGNVLAPFLRRLPPRSDADFPVFLASIGLPPAASVSDFALLAYSEARQVADGFSLVNPFDDVGGPLEFMTDVALYRHDERPKQVVALDQEVAFRREAAAIRIAASNDDNATLGYVADMQAEAFARWLDADVVRAWVAGRNRSQAYPRLSLYVEVSAAERVAAD